MGFELPTDDDSWEVRGVSGGNGGGRGRKETETFFSLTTNQATSRKLPATNHPLEDQTEAGLPPTYTILFDHTTRRQMLCGYSSSTGRDKVSFI